MSYLFDFIYFFFNDPATPEIYTLSLHDALPISGIVSDRDIRNVDGDRPVSGVMSTKVATATPNTTVREAANLLRGRSVDRKSTRLNSSHPSISYAVFCLKKKKKHTNTQSKSTNK